MSPDRAMEIIGEVRGRQLCPECVEAFRSLMRDMRNKPSGPTQTEADENPGAMGNEQHRSTGVSLKDPSIYPDFSCFRIWVWPSFESIIKILPELLFLILPVGAEAGIKKPFQFSKQAAPDP